MDPRTRSQLRLAGAEFRAALRGIPTFDQPPLPHGWLASEMVERYLIAQRSAVRPGQSILEIGSGGHALATVPLANLVGPTGRVAAVERERWGHFQEIARASGLAGRIDPLRADARRLPFGARTFDLATCLHGLRSMGDDDECVEVFREMLRVAGRLLVAETLPEARSAAQRAHLTMYELREEMFRATTGRADDRHYRPLGEIARLVGRAGGVVDDQRTAEVDLPHALAYFSRSLLESVPDAGERRQLLERWDNAFDALQRIGEDHPPVGIVVARAQAPVGAIPPRRSD